MTTARHMSPQETAQHLAEWKNKSDLGQPSVPEDWETLAFEDYVPDGFNAEAKKIQEQPVYNVQCLSGHVYSAAPGSELEQRCIQHEQNGYLDALCVSYEECEGCQEKQRQQEREWASVGFDPYESFSETV